MDYNFINKNSIRIIEVLMGGKLYFSEIYEKAGIKSKNNLLKNLKVLADNKLIIKEKTKSNTYYSLNYSSWVLIAILNLITKTLFEKLPFNIKKAIKEIIFELNPKLAILFGSYAKGNYKKESDIDLLLFDSSEKKEKIKEISKNYGIKINPVFMQLNELDASSESVKHIMRTGYPVTGEEYFYNEFEKI